MREDRFTVTTLAGISKVKNKQDMSIEEVKRITEDVFRIIESKKMDDIENIETDVDLLGNYKKNYVNPKNSPKFPFNISNNELNDIKKQLNNNDDLTFKKDIEITDPLAKLFYAVAWKNDILKRIWHIIEGINDAHSNQDNENKKDALVFYNYGKYLAKPEEHPIIDQHVIRAFLVHRNIKSDNQIKNFRKLNDSSQIKKEYVDEYKKWLNKLGKSMNIEKRKDFFYCVDRQLFALGKTIKTIKTK